MTSSNGRKDGLDVTRAIEEQFSPSWRVWELDEMLALPPVSTLSDPLEVLALLLDAIRTYGDDYMHGIPKSDYVTAAKKAMARLESKHDQEQQEQTMNNQSGETLPLPNINTALVVTGAMESLVYVLDAKNAGDAPDEALEAQVWLLRTALRKVRERLADLRASNIAAGA